MFCVAMQLKSTICFFIPVLLPGVVGKDPYGVSYSPASVCAVTGSTVVVFCTYWYPSGTVTKTLWINKWPDENLCDVTLDPKYSWHAKYLGNKQNNCTFQIGNVTKDNSGTYWFRFETDVDRGKWTGTPGVTLLVTGIEAAVNLERVAEGQNVTVTCEISCLVTDTPPFIWYKNGNLLNGTDPGSRVLYLQSVSSLDSGKYSCALRGHEDLPSPPAFVNVTYAPKNTSVTLSPSGDIVEGGSVTLSCSSTANPPVENYTWFRKSGTEDSQRASGQNFTISQIMSDDSGLYYCRAQNQNGAASSTQVAINVQYAPKNVTLSVIPSADIVENSNVSLRCSGTSNPAVQSYQWFKGGNEVKAGSAQVYTIPSISPDDSGQYYCTARNTLAAGNSTSLLLYVLYAPKNTSVTLSPSGDIVEGGLVTLSCSSTANPPVENYTWFRKSGTEDSQRASGQNFTISDISSRDQGEYFCRASARQGAHDSPSVCIVIRGPSAFVLVPVALGVTICTAALVLSALVCLGWKRFGSSKETKTAGEVSGSPVFADVSGGGGASGPTSGERDKSEVASGQEETNGSGAAPSGTEDNVQYASIRFSAPRGSTASPVRSAEDTPTIYSTICTAPARTAHT